MVIFSFAYPIHFDDIFILWLKSLEKEITIHSSILAWEIPWTEEAGGLQSMILQKSQIRLSDQTITTMLLLSRFSRVRLCVTP